MKIASIVPVKNIEHTFDNSYAMMLTHLKDYYPQTAIQQRNNCYRIMDNSLIELGGAVDIDQVYEAAKQCQAHEIILPDVFRDATKTRQSIYDALDKLSKKGRLYDFRLMAVCQGSTVEEFVNCFKSLCCFPEIHTIGIPKVAETLLPAGRPGFEYLWQNCPKEIHLLGCWTSLNEMRQYKNPAAIRSCDTCIPALLTVNEKFNTWGNRPAKTIDLLQDDISYHYDVYWHHLDVLEAVGML